MASKLSAGLKTSDCGDLELWISRKLKRWRLTDNFHYINVIIFQDSLEVILEVFIPGNTTNKWVVTRSLGKVLDIFGSH